MTGRAKAAIAIRLAPFPSFRRSGSSSAGRRSGRLRSSGVEEWSSGDRKPCLVNKTRTLYVTSEEKKMTSRPKDTPRDRALKMVRRQGIVRARDLKAAGIAAPYLRRLVLDGELEQPARGQYRLAGKAPSAQHTLAVAARAVPNGIICLLSALRVHDLGTQTPHEVWMLIGAKAWAPTVSAVHLRIVRSRDLHEQVGVESRTIEGVEVRLTSAERTVVECFKHRNTVGLDVALEALRELIKRRRGRTDDLWRIAKVFRMQNVMRPYLEASA